MCRGRVYPALKGITALTADNPAGKAVAALILFAALDDAFFLADGAVEIIDVSVHGRIRLLTIDVPHRERDGLLGSEQRFLLIASEKQKRKHTNKNYDWQNFFHKDIPCVAEQAAESVLQKNLKKIQTFFEVSLPFGGLGRGQATL